MPTPRPPLAPRAEARPAAHRRAAPRLAALLLAALLALPHAAAQEATQTPTPADDALPLGEVATFLAAVDEHPSLRAARRNVAAADAELGGLRFPLALSGSVDGTTLGVTSPDPLPDDVIDDVQEWSTTTSIRATLRPFLVGDLADAERQRRLALVQARQGLDEARAALEVGAIRSGAGVLLAERGVRIAEASLALAREARDVAALRVERGAARPRDLERADLDVARAEESLRSASARLRIAEARLADLVGDGVRLPGLPDPAALPPLPDADAVAPSVVAAELDVLRAEIGVDSARRSLLPTAQASYVWNLEDDRSLALSLESRTLQPTLSYDAPSQVPDLEPIPLPTGDARIDVERVLRVGASFEFGGDAVAAETAARERLAAAEANLARARTDAARAADDRAEAIRAARAERDFAERDVALARADAADVRTRASAGLATDLEVRQADLDVLRAELAADEARIAVLEAVLADYADLAVPPSEVLP